MIDIDRLAQSLFGSTRAETQEVATDATTRTYLGVAQTDSEDGTAYVSIEGDITLPDDIVDPEGNVIEAYEDNGIEIAVSPSVTAGDEVVVTLVGGGPLKTPMVTAASGEGDRQDDAIASAAEAAQTAWDYADQANDAAVAAQESADSAQESADAAATAASNAQSDADDAASAAAQAQSDATAAGTAAAQAQSDATAAGTAAAQAQADATAAGAAAAQAQSDATAAGTAAANAQSSANSAASAAAAADTKATNAATAAANAQTSADNAASAAGAAQTSANAAQASANAANANATAALNSLATVEDVVDTLTWITEHGTMAKTADTSVDASKVYFVRDDNGDYTVGNYRYSIVQDPVASGLSSYYELSIDKSVENYIATHLSVTNEGLWLTPTASNGYKVLVATGAGSTYTTAGTYIIDGGGATIARFGGTGIRFAEDKSFTIGDDSAYIYFDGDGHINIGGDNVTIGGSSLSQVLADVAAARAEADAAIDICTISITSTGGTVFKQDRGVSTTLAITIFTGDGLRITDATALHSRFGNGAYLQWKWKNNPEDEFTVLVNTDPRIGAGGFTLTVSPSDVSTQAIIDCDLIF